VAAYPFTTITPNVGRAFVALPDPCLALGVAPDCCHPAHGFARGFDPVALNPSYTNVGPLLKLLQVRGTTSVCGQGCARWAGCFGEGQ
jgi:hypothetical protein